MTAIRIERRPAPTLLTDADWPGLHPVLRRVYAARGVGSAREVAPGLAAMERPDSLGGLDAACRLLTEAIDRQQRILVIGDFDCDGATGAALAVRGLRLLGATKVTFDVPHRMQHGYGLSEALVADLPRPLPDLLITVDSGIACVDGVAAARAEGCRVIVTDHHLQGEQLPAANAIVNPNVEGDAFPSKALAGVGVMFYLLIALRAHLRSADRFANAVEPDLSSLLDLVAVGTVADMVALDRNNRTLVAAGLRRIRAGHCQPGIAALAQVAGKPLEDLSAPDIGFTIGPRINAAGRLEDMRVGIACLLSDDPAEALELATILNDINRERRQVQQQMLDQAEQSLDNFDDAAPASAAVVVHDEGWHPGVVGLVASRLKDRLHRPTIALAPADPEQPDGEWRGSARSIAGFHLRDALAEVDRRQPGLMLRFGGHAMAAGLSIEAANIPRLESALAEVAGDWLTAEQLAQCRFSDGPLAGADFSRELAEQLRDGGPWGQAFPEPAFDNRFAVTSWRVVGERHLKLSLQGLDEADGARVDAIAFGAWPGEPPPARVHLLYQLTTDDYRDRHGVQLIVRHMSSAD
ncbi:MAG: single-stranded-DNA-specific exonuclease RecJ [Xanthomonadales bacterium]|nr:single-stranded-DNA-specific exonuclease RecJ [Xanthomonadales bacterium]